MRFQPFEEMIGCYWEETYSAVLRIRRAPLLRLATGPVAEKRRSPTPILRPGRTRHSQSLGSCGELARQQDFDAAAQKIARRGIVRAERLSAGSLAAAIEARRKDAGVIEDQEIAGPKQVREFAELAVLVAAGPVEVQHAGSFDRARRPGFLGDEFIGKMEVEVGNQHGVRL
jgi:hypothetical protein